MVHCMKKKSKRFRLDFAMQQFLWLLNQLTRPPTFESSVFMGKVPISLLKNTFKYSETKDFHILEFREKLAVFQYYFKREEKMMLKTTNRKQGNTGTTNYSITSFWLRIYLKIMFLTRLFSQERKNKFYACTSNSNKTQIYLS